MAEVTLGAQPPAVRHVNGDTVTRFFAVNGASGTTLHTGMINLLWVVSSPFCLAGTASLITGISYNAATGVITFTSSNTMINELIQVVAIAG